MRLRKLVLGTIGGSSLLALAFTALADGTAVAPPVASSVAAPVSATTSPAPGVGDAGAAAAAQQLLLTGKALDASLDQRSQKLDESLQKLKADALSFNVDATHAEESALYPPATRQTVYVTVTAKGVLLHELDVSIDGAKAVRKIYSDIEALALLNGDARVLRLNLGPGSHRVQAKFVAYYEDYLINEPPLTGEIDSNFTRDESANALELVVAPGSEPLLNPKTGKPVLVAKPYLTLRTWSAR